MISPRWCVSCAGWRYAGAHVYSSWPISCIRCSREWLKKKNVTLIAVMSYALKHNPCILSDQLKTYTYGRIHKLWKTGHCNSAWPSQQTIAFHWLGTVLIGVCDCEQSSYMIGSYNQDCGLANFFARVWDQTRKTAVVRFHWFLWSFCKFYGVFSRYPYSASTS